MKPVEMKWEGTLPDFESWDFSELLAEAAEHMWASVHENFDVGGRPRTWRQKKDGTPSYLTKTGRLKGAIQSESDDKSFRVFVDKGEVPYCFAHQFGYMQRNLRARPYMMFQDSDKEYLERLFGETVVKLFKTKRRPVGTQS
jgi:phage gpG-like protein